MTSAALNNCRLQYTRVDLVSILAEYSHQMVYFQFCVRSLFSVYFERHAKDSVVYELLNRSDVRIIL